MNDRQAISPAAIGARFGLFAGLICVVFFLTLYLISKDLMVSFWVFAGYAVLVLFKILAVHTARKQAGNYIEFKKGLQAAFLVSVVGLLIWIIFFHLLFQFVDPELTDLSRDKALERIEKFMTMAGAPEDKIEEAMDAAEEKSYEPSLKADAMNYAWSLIIGFLYAAVIAGIYHYAGRKPEPPQNTEAT